MRAAILCVLLSAAAPFCLAQQATANDQERLKQLSQAVEQQQLQIEQSQRELTKLRKQIEELQRSMAVTAAPAPNAPAEASPESASGSGDMDELRERQQMNEEAIAVHEQTKVETESKYPLKVSGLILVNGFINSKAADSPVVPVIATEGPGAAGFSMRQTTLGLEAHGPRLWGADTEADLHIDFFGRIPQNSQNAVGGVLRMRTAHARLRWNNSELFGGFDRPIAAPFMPASLVQVAMPALSWAGTLWSWFPQVGASHDFGTGASGKLSVAGTLVDVADPPLPNANVVTTTAAERSRSFGTIGRIGWRAGDEEGRPQFGVGGYLSPHKSVGGESYNAWAVTTDWTLPLGTHLQFTGQAYRGRALGGLGEGVFKDYIEGSGEKKGLDDVGGWAELKQRANSRWEFNETYGIDNGFARTLRKYSTFLTGPSYMPLARNRMFFTNVIYRPHTYLQFSLEYRMMQSSPIIANTVTGHYGGMAAAYSF